jgi:protease I
MSRELEGKRIGFLTANEGVEQIELTSPWGAVTGAAATAVHIAPEVGAVQAFDHLDRADSFEATVTTADADASDLDALVLPGGVANPDQLRLDDAALQLVRAVVDAGKPVAVICHGPWTLIDADVVRGRTLTSWPSLRTDLRHAGAVWVDEEVVVCTNGPNTIVSSRRPDDLEAFNRELIGAVSGASDRTPSDPAPTGSTTPLP